MSRDARAGQRSHRQPPVSSGRAAHRAVPPTGSNGQASPTATPYNEAHRLVSEAIDRVRHERNDLHNALQQIITAAHTDELAAAIAGGQALLNRQPATR